MSIILKVEYNLKIRHIYGLDNMQSLFTVFFECKFCFLEKGFSKIRSLIFGKFISFLLVKKCVAQHEPWLLFLNIYLVILEPLIE